MLSPGQYSRLQAAVAHQLAGRFPEAAPIYEALLREAPDDFQVNHLLGVLRHQQERSTEALSMLNKAVSLMPRSAPTHMCLGLALSAVGRHADAEKAMGVALSLAPNDVETWSNLGAIYALVGRTEESLACFRRALQLNPAYAPAWVGQGAALQVLGRCGEALESHNRALELDPASTKVRFCRAQTLQALQRPDEAMADFDAHLAHMPGHHQARSFRLFLLNFRDDLTPEQLFAEHRAYGEAVEASIGAQASCLRTTKTAAGTPALLSSDPDRKLRLAFLSPDLRGHSVAYFLEPLLAHLDRSRFEILLYHDHHSVDPVSRRFRAGASVWRQFSGFSNSAVAEAIRGDSPDVLVDLAGHTGFNRLELFAGRLAPVQVTYLGYPATTGLKAMDYRFTDAIADPPGRADRVHTERLFRFSSTTWVYAPPAEAPEPAPGPGLRGEPVTFGSFNTWAKVSDSTLRLWRRLLAEIPSARLAIKSSGLEPARCRHRLEAFGFPLDRVSILPMAPGMAEHLGCYAQLDLALDPFPYNGTTTTCEALWMGVPVLALAGDRHSARVGASLLTTIGHPEWVAGSEDEYVAIAARLAADLPLRSRLRTDLREEMRRSPLFDYQAQADRFGDAIWSCWHDRHEGTQAFVLPAAHEGAHREHPFGTTLSASPSPRSALRRLCPTDAADLQPVGRAAGLAEADGDLRAPLAPAPSLQSAASIVP